MSVPVKSIVMGTPTVAMYFELCSFMKVEGPWAAIPVIVACVKSHGFSPAQRAPPLPSDSHVSARETRGSLHDVSHMLPNVVPSAVHPEVRCVLAMNQLGICASAHEIVEAAHGSSPIHFPSVLQVSRPIAEVEVHVDWHVFPAFKPSPSQPLCVYAPSWVYHDGIEYARNLGNLVLSPHVCCQLSPSPDVAGPLDDEVL